MEIITYVTKSAEIGMECWSSGVMWYTHLTEKKEIFSHLIYVIMKTEHREIRTNS